MLLDNFIIVRYKKSKEVLKAYREDFFKVNKHAYYNSEGVKKSMSPKEWHNNIEDKGLWGFMTIKEDDIPAQVHIWIDEKKASFEDVIRLLSHEMGHCQPPFYVTPEKTNRRKEESKANIYEKVAISAYKLAKDIFSEDTKFKADN